MTGVYVGGGIYELVSGWRCNIMASFQWPFGLSCYSKLKMIGWMVEWMTERMGLMCGCLSGGMEEWMADWLDC